MWNGNMRYNKAAQSCCTCEGGAKHPAHLARAEYKIPHMCCDPASALNFNASSNAATPRAATCGGGAGVWDPREMQVQERAETPMKTRPAGVIFPGCFGRLSTPPTASTVPFKIQPYSCCCPTCMLPSAAVPKRSA